MVQKSFAGIFDAKVFFGNIAFPLASVFSGCFDVRPILMQLDFQSVEKYLSVRSHELLPRKCWKMV